jgi:uncharacterized protein
MSGITLHQQAFSAAYASVTHLLALHQQQHPDLSADLRPQLEQLEQLQVKLKQQLIQIAAFGLVSRGKSAVLNALYGEKVFQTGPLNGVTQWPRSVRLAWGANQQNLAGQGEALNQIQSALNIELVDTPGLDEVAGASRGEMARAVAQEADVILFISAGALTPNELQALQELAQLQKPIFLVLNKQDLYPDLLPEQIHAQFLSDGLAHPPKAGSPVALSEILTPQEMVLTTAAPAPIQVRQQWPDGRAQTSWETPPVDIQALRHRLGQFLQQEAGLLTALRALQKAEKLESVIATQIFQQRQTPAQKQVWQYGAAKTLGVIGSIWPGIDLLWASLVDLLLIRQLGKTYGFPVTQATAKQIWPVLLRNLIILLCSEWGSSSLEGANPGLVGISAFFLPGIAAGFATYQVAKITQAGLATASGPQGTQTTQQALKQHLHPQMLITRLLG